MSWQNHNSMQQENRCEAVREEFGSYLDGTISGVEMNAIATHLEDCRQCANEFADLRLMQQALSSLGPAQTPVSLQDQLLEALAVERNNGTHLPFGRRVLALFRDSIAPMALRVSAGIAVAAVLIGSLVWMYAPSLAVQANDDAMAHLVGPHYLYSEVPPQPIETRHDTPIVIEAKVDTEGRVYDYYIVEGPKDHQVQVKIQENLLASVFKPATVFGVPVRGHVLLTYTGVSVRG